MSKKKIEASNECTKKCSAGETLAGLLNKEAMIYVGPTIPGFARNKTIYCSLTDAMKKMVSETPQLSGLFVKLSDYPEAQRQIHDNNGFIYLAYKTALNLGR